MVDKIAMGRLLLFFVLSIISITSVRAQSAYELHKKYLRGWVPIAEAEKDGNSFEGLERIVDGKFGPYSIGHLTIYKTKYQNDFDLEFTKKFYQEHMKLKGFNYRRLGNAHRFEGFSDDLNRQVVAFVSIENGKLITSTAMYRASYGVGLSLEVELWHRLTHKTETKVSKIDFKSILDILVPKAHAIDCSYCNGNPICLALCQAGEGGPEGSGGFGSMDWAGLNQNLTQANANFGVLNGQLTEGNINWNNSNQNWTQSNQLWTQSNQLWGQSNTLWGETNSIIDKRSGEFLQESEKWREQTDKMYNGAMEESKAWRDMMEKQSNRALDMADKYAERGMRVAEKMVDPVHLGLMAAGTVIGGSVATMAFNTATKLLGVFFKEISGKAAKERREHILKNFAEAQKVYNESNKAAKELEKSIDNFLIRIEAYKALKKKYIEQQKKLAAAQGKDPKNFKDSDLAADLSKRLTLLEEKSLPNAKDKLKAASAAEEEQCLTDVTGIKDEIAQIKAILPSLSKADPMVQTCKDMQNAFADIQKYESDMQNLRSDLIYAEEARNEDKASKDNQAIKTYEKIRKNTRSKQVAEDQRKHMFSLFQQNEKDAKKLRDDIKRDCRQSFSDIGWSGSKKTMKDYCDKYILNTNAPLKDDLGISEVFADMPADKQAALKKEFDKHLIGSGVKQYFHYETERVTTFKEFNEEIDRHKETMRDLKDRMYLDPQTALEGMASMNAYTEKLARDQASLYDTGIKMRELEIDEACEEFVGKREHTNAEVLALKQAEEDIKRLNGSKIGDTRINCDPRLLRTECAMQLKALEETLKTQQIKVPNIVMMPAYLHGRKSMLIIDKNPELNMLMINSKVSQDQLSDVIEKQSKKLDRK